MSDKNLFHAAYRTYEYFFTMHMLKTKKICQSITIAMNNTSNLNEGWFIKDGFGGCFSIKSIEGERTSSRK